MIPSRALAVRQPWAWAIFHADPLKDIENRSAGAIKYLSKLGPTAIHASAGMTRADYVEARSYMREIGVECPLPADLIRGGIIGHVTVAEIVTASDSPWFFDAPGNRGLRLIDATPCDFIPVTGVLGYFNWRELPGGKPMEPMPWMKPKQAAQGELLPAPTAGLFMGED